MNFFERLQIVLDGRREYTWAKGLGINRGTIQNLKEKDVIPGWETLYAIRRAEGVNIEWLTEGVGEPFIVHRSLSDGECADFVEAHLIDEDWLVTLATDWQRAAVILSMPGSATLAGRAGRAFTYDYTITEIMLGVGRATLDVIADKSRRIMLSEQTRSNMDAIYRGQVGPYRLLNAPDAWLKKSKSIDRTHTLFTETLPTPRTLTHDEENLIKIYERMAAEQRATYKAIGTAIAQQEPDKKQGNGQ